VKNKAAGFSLLLTFFLIPGALFAQSSGSIQTNQAVTSSGTDSDTEAAIRIRRLQLALSSADYRVTPGDIYSLTYAAGSAPVNYSLVVDSNYRIRVSNLGMVDASGKTFYQVKSQVETIVSNNYPLSGVQFVLAQPALFKLNITGEVTQTVEVSAWALDRVSSLLAEYLTPFSSQRDVAVRSADGRTQVYDLFKAARFGDMSQDPYLRPGDVIIVNRVSRAVTINGAVERPGRYQLLEGENLKDLIETYGSGFTPVADKTRVELVRQVNSVSSSGDKIFLSEGDIAGGYALENYDTVTVPEITGLQPVMFVEGAIGSAAGPSPTTSTRLTVSFSRGDTYASLVRRNRTWFTAVSDSRNAYIIRGDAQIPINLNPMLYDAEYRSAVLVEENDTLIIPFRQYFVTVAGAVISPGRYPYIPDRTWDYYIALAGGFVQEKNTWQSVAIADMTGKRMRKSSVITPETVITAKTNAFLYYFNQYAPVILTTFSLITTYFTVRDVLRNR
jgi:protein involved in polysaccharide export with SLBB domain